MAVFCNPDTLVAIRRDESLREALEAEGFVLVRGDSVASEVAEPVKAAPKKSKKVAE